MKWWDQMPWSSFFWIFSFKPVFSLSVTFIKRLISPFPLSACIRVVSCAYLRLLIFLPPILIPACSSWSPEFCLKYSVYKLNKQSDNIQPCRTPFLSFDAVCCSISGSNCCFLTCIQVSQEVDKVIWYFHTFKNFPQFIVIHTVKALVYSMKQK